MPRLIILAGQGRATMFELKGTAVIGRSEDCDLPLQNVSVSRRHAEVTVVGDGVSIRDLDSNNGVWMGGKQVDSGTLSPGDEVRIGRYTLILVSDTERFYKGRYIGYMAEHGGRPPTDDATYTLEASEVAKIEERRHLIRDARVVLASNARRFWYPEDRSLTFGKSAMVQVEGVLGGGTVAEVVWTGACHQVKRSSKITRLRVNGEAVTEHDLSLGDSFQLGSTTFSYELTPESD